MSYQMIVKVTVRENRDWWTDPLNAPRERVRPLEIGQVVTVHPDLNERNAAVFAEAIRVTGDGMAAQMPEFIREHLTREVERPPAPVRDPLFQWNVAPMRRQAEEHFEQLTERMRQRLTGRTFDAAWFDEPKPTAKDLSTLW